MRVPNPCLHTDPGEYVACSIEKHDYFYTCTIGPSKVTIFFQNPQDVVNFKNNFLSAFNKFTKEANYGK